MSCAGWQGDDDESSSSAASSSQSGGFASAQPGFFDATQVCLAALCLATLCLCTLSIALPAFTLPSYPLPSCARPSDTTTFHTLPIYVLQDKHAGAVLALLSFHMAFSMQSRTPGRQSSCNASFCVWVLPLVPHSQLLSARHSACHFCCECPHHRQYNKLSRELVVLALETAMRSNKKAVVLALKTAMRSNKKPVNDMSLLYVCMQSSGPSFGQHQQQQQQQQASSSGANGAGGKGVVDLMDKMLKVSMAACPT